MKKRVFISYSRKDSSFITAIVSLLRSALSGRGNPNPVFLDSDTIPPGQSWRMALEQAIREAEKVFVFWCAHSAASAEVKKEYSLALSIGKIVIPVLLDDTPLPPGLSEFQWIDLTALTPHRPVRIKMWLFKGWLPRSFKRSPLEEKQLVEQHRQLIVDSFTPLIV